MGKVIRSVFIFSLVLVLASCEYWNKDMLGYLEYWGSNSIVGRVIVSPTPENIGGKQIVQPGTPVKVELHLMNGQSIPTTVSLPSSNWSTSTGTGTPFTNQYPNAINTAILNLESPKNGESLALNFQLAASDGTRPFPSYSWGTLISDARPEDPTDVNVDTKKTPVEATWRANVTGDHEDVYKMEVKWSRKGGGVVATDILTKESNGWTLSSEPSRLTTKTSPFVLQAPPALSQNTNSTDFNVGITLFDKVGQTSSADLTSALKTSTQVTFANAGLDATNTKVQVILSASNAATIWYRIGGSSDWIENAGNSVTIGVDGGAKVEAKAQENGKAVSPVTQHNAGVVVTFHSNDSTTGTKKQVFPYNENHPLPDNLFTASGSNKFLGWAESSTSGTATYSKDDELALTENKDLYAIWGTTVYYVDANGNDNNDGKSANRAFKTVQKAVDAINAINDEQSSYTINVKGITSGNINSDTYKTQFATVVLINPNKNLNLTIQGDDPTRSLINAGGNGRAMFVGGNGTAKVTVTLKNIKITGGDITNKDDRSGGGIKVYSATLILDTGAEIKDNSATNGGGIVVDKKNGGANSELIIKAGAEIKNNSATSGGGVYVKDGCTITMEGGTISGNTATSNGKGIYNSGTFTMSGSATVDANNDVYLPSGKTITVDSALTGTAPVATITPQTYASSTRVLNGTKVDEVVERFELTQKDGEEWKIGYNGNLFKYDRAYQTDTLTRATSANDALQKLSAGKSVIFDMTRETPFTPLDLYANTGNFSPGKNYAIHVPKNTTLVINGNDKVLKEAVNCGNLLNVEGILVLNDVRIAGTNLNWSVIDVLDGARVILNNCIIENNTGGQGSNQRGGVICIADGGTAIMNGGKIEENHLAGANIYDGGSFTIRGGVIQNNDLGGVRKKANATYVNEGDTVDKVENY